MLPINPYRLVQFCHYMHCTFQHNCASSQTPLIMSGQGHGCTQMLFICDCFTNHHSLLFLGLAQKGMFCMATAESARLSLVIDKQAYGPCSIWMQVLCNPCMSGLSYQDLNQHKTNALQVGTAHLHFAIDVTNLWNFIAFLCPLLLGEVCRMATSVRCDWRQQYGHLQHKIRLILYLSLWHSHAPCLLPLVLRTMI